MANDTTIALIEQTLIQKIIVEPDHVYEVNEEDFVSDTAVALITSIKNLVNNNVEINARNLHIEVNRLDSISESNIEVLFNGDEVSDKAFEYLYKSLLKEKARYELNNTLVYDLIREGAKKGELDIDKVQEISRDINSLVLSINTDKTLILDGETMLDRYEVITRERAKGNSFYDTGCSHLNSILTEGFPPQKITTIFGPSGIGKSTYALHLVNRQINKQIPSNYISLEMDLISTVDRLICMRHSIPISDIIPNKDSGFIVQEDIVKIVEQERNALGNNKYFTFIDKPVLNLSDVSYIIEESKAIMGVDYLICTIDLGTMISEFNLGSSKASDYEHAMNGLHVIARNTNSHIVIVVQSRRPSQKVVIDCVEDLEKYRPQIEEIKNSGAIEERSRTIISTFRAKHFGLRVIPDDPQVQAMDDLMDITVLKQNMGRIDKVSYLFDPERYILVPFIPEETGPSNFVGAMA